MREQNNTEPESKRQSHISRENAAGMALFISKKGETVLKKDNKFATNQGGVIKAPRPQKDQPKATVTKGSDLRDGKKSK